MHCQWCFWGLRKFWVFQHQNLVNPARVDQVPVCIPIVTNHWSALFIQSHLVAFSTALVLEWIALLFVAPVIPSTVRALQGECHTKLQQPTGCLSAPIFPLFYQLLVFAKLPLMNLLHVFSKGTVSSHMITCWVEFEKIPTVWAECCWYNVIWNLQPLHEICSQLPVWGHRK